MKRLACLMLAAVAAVAAYSCGDAGEPVIPPTPANQAPVPVGTIPARDVPATDTVSVDLAGYFSDPDGDRLVYSASSSNAAIVATAVSGSVLSLVAGAKGAATVAATATDPGGLTATQRWEVTVVAKPGVLLVVLTRSEPGVGAVVVGVDGPSIDSVRAGPDLAAYHVATPTGLRAFVAGGILDAGSLPEPALLEFWSADVSEIASYSVSVNQVAARSYEQRPAESVRASVIRRVPTG